MRSCHQTKACGDKKEIFSPLWILFLFFFRTIMSFFQLLQPFSFPPKIKILADDETKKNINSFYWAL